MNNVHTDIVNEFTYVIVLGTLDTNIFMWYSSPYVFQSSSPSTEAIN